MPGDRSAYKRGYKTTGGRGHSPSVFCGYCGTKFPRHKAFIQYRGFRITDPVLRKELDRQQLSAGSQKVYACPACARHRGIVQKGDAYKKRPRMKG